MNVKHKTSIGGQSVMEGVMMLGPDNMAISVRKPDGEILTDIRPVGKASKNKFAKLPIIRGCFGFFRSMITGVKALMFSADQIDLEEEEPTKFDKWLEKVFGDKLKDYVVYFSVVLSVIMSVGLFILLPTWIVSLITSIFKGAALTSGILKSLIEGVIRICIFLIIILF